MKTRHFLDLSDFSGEQIRHVLNVGSAIKAKRRKGELATERPLEGKVLAMVFDKPSTRTRVSFDVGMRELGGETLMLTGRKCSSAGARPSRDTARVLSRYVDAIMIRTLDHAMVTELAEPHRSP